MKTFLTACALLLFTATADAAIVHLKEGGTLEGVLVSSTPEEVMLDTASGRVVVAMSKVSRIDNTVAAPAPAPATYLEPRSEAGRQVFSVSAGLAVPLSASFGNSGPALGLQYLYYASPRVGWGVEFQGNARGLSESRGMSSNVDTAAFGDTLLMLGVLKASLTDRGPVRPFVLVGGGFYRNSLIIDGRPSPGFVWSDTGTGEARRLIEGSASGLAMSVRTGLDFGFYDPSSFSLEAGWTALASGTYAATPQGRALGISGVKGALNYFTLTGRWGFSF